MKTFLGYSILLLLLAICLTSCAANHVPQSGIWRCDELNITLDFKALGNSKMEADNKTVFLSIENDKNSNTIILSGKHPKAGSLTEIFAFDCMDLTDCMLTVRVRHSTMPAVGIEGKIYQFYKIK